MGSSLRVVHMDGGAGSEAGEGAFRKAPAACRPSWCLPFRDGTFLIATGAAELIAVDSDFLDDDFFFGILAWARGCCVSAGVRDQEFAFGKSQIELYLFTRASFSSKDAPVGAVRSAVAWQHARDQHAGGGRRPVSTRPEGPFQRESEPGHPEQPMCGDAVLLLEGQVRRVLQVGCRSTANVRLCW